MHRVIATLAACAATASAVYVPTTTTTTDPTPTYKSSFVSCGPSGANVTCPFGYREDPKTGGVMRCKPRTGTTMPCNESYCCNPTKPYTTTTTTSTTTGYVTPTPTPKPTSSFVSCGPSGANVTCPLGYKEDPKTGGVMRCKPRTGTSMPCNEDYCCNPTKPYTTTTTTTTTSYVTPTLPVPPPADLPCCDAAGVKCSTYRPDPFQGGVIRCDASKKECNKDFCCSPNPTGFVSCAEVIPCPIYQKDPKGDQIMRCKNRSTSTMACTIKQCCVLLKN